MIKGQYDLTIHSTQMTPFPQLWHSWLSKLIETLEMVKFQPDIQVSMTDGHLVADGRIQLESLGGPNLLGPFSNLPVYPPV